MKKTVLLLILFATAYLFCSDRNEIKYVKEKVNLRAGRSTDYKIVKILQAGEEFKTGILRDNWYSVFPASATSNDYKSIIGYIYSPLVFTKKNTENLQNPFGGITKNISSAFSEFDVMYDENNKPVYFSSSSDNGMTLKVFGEFDDITKVVLSFYIFKDDPDMILGFRMLTANRFITNIVPKINAEERWVETQFNEALQNISKKRVKYKNTEKFAEKTICFEYNEESCKCRITVFY
jgi:hypothetical protein